MKITCRCGAHIVDGTDDLPHKAHVVPDQDWLAIHAAIDAAIEATAAARLGADAACHRTREAVTRPARLLWQCRACGRLFLEDRNRQLRCFAPDGEPIDRDILRSRPG